MSNLIKMHFDYLAYDAKQDITEKTADIMMHIENLIVTSNAYKMQGNKPVYQNKWQAFKLQKTPYNELCLIFNKINSTNVDQMVAESAKYTDLSYKDLQQLADTFLGKCIIEPKNIETYITYFKKILKLQLWYVYYEDKVISFRDLSLEVLEKECKRLTEIAKYVEEMYANKYTSSDTPTNSNNIIELARSDDYLKKKNIIVNLIDIFGSMFNNKLLSVSILESILEHLKSQNVDISSSKKIYFELWLVLWNKINHTLRQHFPNIYERNYEWLLTQKKIITCERLLLLINNSITPTTINVVPQNDTNIYTIVNEIATLKTDADYKEFAKNKSKLTISKYVIKYLLEQCNIDKNKFVVTIPLIIKYLIKSKNKFDELINQTLNDDELVCDYPNFKQYFTK